MPALIAAAVFAAIFLLYTRPIELGDVWWHLNTGRWMWEHGTLPSHDPFTYTVAETGTRVRVILSGFWLAQALYYAVYQTAGFPGLIALKAATFTVLFFVLREGIRRRGMGSAESLAVTAAIALLTMSFEEVRPQTFSFLAAVLLFLAIERALARLRSGERLGLRDYFFGAIVMLLWANLHRGFIIGYAMLGVYAVSECAKLIAGRGPLGRRALGSFMLFTGAAVLASVLNPNHIHVTGANLSELFMGGSVETIEEYKTPWAYAEFYGSPGLLWGLAAFALATIVVLALSFRSLDPAHWLLYAGFALMAARSFRFTIFYVLIAALIAAPHAARLMSRTPSLTRAASWTAIPLLVALMLFFAERESSLMRGTLDRTYLPEGAADFLLSARPPGPLFNPYEWGGYLAWRLYPDGRLYPEGRVFVDARTLDQEVHAKYKTAKLGRPAGVFREYAIRTVIFYPLNPVTGEVPPLIFVLLKDDAWRLVYIDRVSCVFVRADALGRMPELGKEIVWEGLIEWFTRLQDAEPGDPEHAIQLGIIRLAQGEDAIARTLFEKALALDPENAKARAWLDRLRATRETSSR